MVWQYPSGMYMLASRLREHPPATTTIPYFLRFGNCHNRVGAGCFLSDLLLEPRLTGINKLIEIRLFLIKALWWFYPYLFNSMLYQIFLYDITFKRTKFNEIKIILWDKIIPTYFQCLQNRVKHSLRMICLIFIYFTNSPVDH